MVMLLSFNGKLALISVLFIVVLISAISVVYTKHINRKYFTELQKLEYERDEMNIEWGQLQLEKSTVATDSEIELSARKKLGMNQPNDRKVISITP